MCCLWCQASVDSKGDDLEELREELREVVGGISDLREMVRTVRGLIQAPIQLLSNLIFEGLKSSTAAQVPRQDDRAIRWEEKARQQE